MPTAIDAAPLPRAVRMPVTPDTVALVRHFEGRRLTAYRCPAGVWTIGYGHTGPDVVPGLVATEAQAEIWLAGDLMEAADAVDLAVTVPLTAEQRGALASFVFNLGAGAFRSSTLLRKLNAGDRAGAAAELDRWVKATVDGRKVTLAGLVKRRAAERAMFEGRDWREALDEGAMPQAVAPPVPAMKPLAQSRTVRGGAAGLGVAGGVAVVQELAGQVGVVRTALDQLREYLPEIPAGWLAAGVLAVAVGYMLYRRWDDKRRAEAAP